MRLQLLILTHVCIKCLSDLVNLQSRLLLEFLNLVLINAILLILLLYFQLFIKLLEILFLALELFVLIGKHLHKCLNVLLKIVDLLLLARCQVSLLYFSFAQLLL